MFRNTKQKQICLCFLHNHFRKVWVPTFLNKNSIRSNSDKQEYPRNIPIVPPMNDIGISGVKSSFPCTLINGIASFAILNIIEEELVAW